MKYAHIIHYFNSEPWAILPEKLHAIISLIELRAAGMTVNESELESKYGQTAGVMAPSSVALLPVMGTISHRSLRSGLFRFIFSGTTVEDFRTDFRAAVRNPDIQAIVLDIDSPGGSTSGIEEIASEIYEARKHKRIIASVNSLAASAAYWIASAAHEIAVTPSGHVGSIGVLGVHMDFSEKARAEGINVTVVSAGKYKAEASEFTPLTDGAKAHLQVLVDDRYNAFVKAVARGRGVSQKTVRDGYGEGRLVAAQEALSLGMVDSIETTDEVLSRTAGRAARARKIAEAASWQFGIMGDEAVFDLGAAVMDATVVEMLAQEQQGFKPQTLVAPKDKWASLDAARSWAKEHGYRVDKVDETENSWRFRQRDPGDFQTLRTICINPGRDAASGTCKMFVVGGRLKAGAAAEVRDPNVVDVDEFLADAVIPNNVSDTLAPEGTAWDAPALTDFTDKPWGELAAAERRRIATHAAWAKAMPPENFGDIKLFHHRPSDGAIVPNGVRNALARLSQTQGVGDEQSRVEAHLRRHLNAIQERNQEAQANPVLDPQRVEIELMELG